MNVFIIHRLYNSWTEHSVLGVYSDGDRALKAALEELKDLGSSPEQCQQLSPSIKTQFTDVDNEFSIWITEHEVVNE